LGDVPQPVTNMSKPATRVAAAARFTRRGMLKRLFSRFTSPDANVFDTDRTDEWV
jgi:hypothetical protein